MPLTSAPIFVNRAPVLTLWAAVVAERLGYPPETSLTLGRYVAGSSARAKARRLGIVEETEEAAERREKARELRPQRQTVRLLGREVPVLPAADGTLRAEADGKPSSANSVASYIARAFGDRSAEVRAAMAELAASMPREELNRIGFRLYERFRPEVPEGVKGWGAKAQLRLERIRGAGYS
jgi:hypothetical protein